MMKHVDIRGNFIRDHLKTKGVELIYCPTEEMIADIFTKALSPVQHRKLVFLMGMRSLADIQMRSPIPAFTERNF